MSQELIDRYQKIIDDLYADGAHHFIETLPSWCGETLDRLLYERPISNEQDNWILRLEQLRGLDRASSIRLIRSWKRELDQSGLH